MKSIKNFYFDIKRINVAHEFVLDQKDKCEYLNSRKFYGVIYALSGEAEYRFSDGNRLTIREGEVLLLSPKATYAIVTTKPFKHFTVNFELHISTSNLSFFTDDFCLLHTENSEWYRHTFKELVTHWQNRKSGYEMRATASLYQLLAFLCTEIHEQKYNTATHLRLRPVKEYIEQNFNRNISLNLLANYASMSTTHFRREWTKIYGTSPLQYRDTLRLSYAKEYLLTGYYSVTEVAEKCGFEDTNYFIRFFKKHTGITPKNFSKL